VAGNGPPAEQAERFDAAGTSSPDDNRVSPPHQPPPPSGEAPNDQLSSEAAEILHPPASSSEPARTADDALSATDAGQPTRIGSPLGTGTATKEQPQQQQGGHDAAADSDQELFLSELLRLPSPHLASSSLTNNSDERNAEADYIFDVEKMLNSTSFDLETCWETFDAGALFDSSELDTSDRIDVRPPDLPSASEIPSSVDGGSEHDNKNGAVVEAMSSRSGDLARLRQSRKRRRSENKMAAVSENVPSHRERRNADHQSQDCYNMPILF
jgi:hypothetical protein